MMQFLLDIFLDPEFYLDAIVLLGLLGWIYLGSKVNTKEELKELLFFTFSV
jgi:arginine exporter protein ArgO